MASRKQRILAELMHHIICCARGAQTGPALWRLRHGEAYRRAFEDLNLIHRIPHSIIIEEYTENDISFINWGIERYLKKREVELDSRTAWLLLEFVNGVPEAQQNGLTWKPSQALRERAGLYEHELLYE